LACKARLGAIVGIQRWSHTGQARRRVRSCGQPGFCQEVIAAVTWPQAKASDGAHPSDHREPWAAHAPAHAMTPAQRGLPRSPATPTALGGAHGYAHAVDHFIADARPADLLTQGQSEGHDGVVVAAHQALELTASRQPREGPTQASAGVAIKGALAL